MRIAGATPPPSPSDSRPATKRQAFAGACRRRTPPVVTLALRASRLRGLVGRGAEGLREEATAEPEAGVVDSVGEARARLGLDGNPGSTQRGRGSRQLAIGHDRIGIAVHEQ